MESDDDDIRLLCQLSYGICSYIVVEQQIRVQCDRETGDDYVKSVDLEKREIAFATGMPDAGSRKILHACRPAVLAPVRLPFF